MPALCRRAQLIMMAQVAAPVMNATMATTQALSKEVSP